MARWRRPPLISPGVGLLAVTLAALLGGLAAGLAGARTASDAIFVAGTAVGLGVSLESVIQRLWRRQLGVDVIALLALAGALAVREFFAGAVIAVMLTGGRALEAWAGRRARRDLSALLDRAPREAMRYRDGELERCAVEEIRPGDRLLVRPGEVVPVDGLVETGTAVLDESALTGEPMPTERGVGEAARSGVVNSGGPFDLRATTTTAESSYAGIVRLVEQAQATSAPFVRLADRYAVFFLPITLVIAAAAWLASGDPVRAVAVLVVATPCPLILAAPIAIVAGLSRMARRGVVVKGGAALERLARGQTLLLDKTGTLTLGHPTLARVVTAEDWATGDLLGLAASLDQVSPHVLAASIVAAGRAQGLALSLPHGVEEEHGQGIRGLVDGRRVAVGRAAFVADTVPPWARSARRRAELNNQMTTFVGVEGALAGVLLFEDPIRPDAARTIRRLRLAGIQRMVLVSGDRAEVAEGVGAAMGLDEVLSERTPAEKVEAVRFETTRAPTIMVGDGINDAPALAAATVGVALGARGATASSEAADVVLTVDRLDRLGDAIVAARRSRGIALQSVVVGMALSFAAMGLAAVGLLVPAAGALLQEAIDLAVILNALRALGEGRAHTAVLTGPEAALTYDLSLEHEALRPGVEDLQATADALDTLPPGEALVRAHAALDFLRERIIPHERIEEEQLYPLVARALGGDDPTGAMSRTHAEIAHQTHRLGRLLEEIGEDDPDAEDLRELRRLLYGLYAILRLHFAQEEESYFSLADDEAAPNAGTGRPTVLRAPVDRS